MPKRVDGQKQIDADVERLRVLDPSRREALLAEHAQRERARSTNAATGRSAYNPDERSGAARADARLAGERMYELRLTEREAGIAASAAADEARRQRDEQWGSAKRVERERASRTCEHGYRLSLCPEEGCAFHAKPGTGTSDDTSRRDDPRRGPL
jgi:hypothetical protein